MNRRFALVAVAVFAILCSTSVLVQGRLTGKWQGTTNRGREVQMDLKAVKTELTGTLTIDKAVGKITEGKVTKDRFTFKAPMQGRPVAFSGLIRGDEVELTPEGATDPVVLKRMKSK
jgi:hypothetical protein